MSNARRAAAAASASASQGRWGRAAVVVAPLLLAFVIPLACASDPELVGAGDECFAATDCAPGLVCVPQRGGARVCSSDLSQVVGRPPAEAGAADGDDVADGQSDGPEEGSNPGQDANVPDTSLPDTSVADAAEAG